MKQKSHTRFKRRNIVILVQLSVIFARRLLCVAEICSQLRGTEQERERESQIAVVLIKIVLSKATAAAPFPDCLTFYFNGRQSIPQPSCQNKTNSKLAQLNGCQSCLTGMKFHWNLGIGLEERHSTAGNLLKDTYMFSWPYLCKVFVRKNTEPQHRDTKIIISRSIA